MDLNMLRAINQARIETLAEQGDSADLFRAQLVGKILEDDNCFAEMELDECVEILVAMGFKDEAARQQAKALQNVQKHSKKLTTMKK